MYLSVTGAKAYDDMVYTGNSALYIPEGRISGFRLRQRRLSTSQTLSKMDSIILSIARNGCNVHTPFRMRRWSVDNNQKTRWW